MFYYHIGGQGGLLQSFGPYILSGCAVRIPVFLSCCPLVCTHSPPLSLSLSLSLSLWGNLLVSKPVRTRARARLASSPAAPLSFSPRRLVILAYLCVECPRHRHGRWIHLGGWCQLGSQG